MIDELEFAVGGVDRNEAGNGVNDQPKALGAETKCLFGACAIQRHASSALARILTSSG